MPKNEYSHANRLGQRTPAGAHSMQVNKQPSPWPCVVMLVGLLLFCLVAPSYWEQEQSKKTDHGTQSTDDQSPRGLNIVDGRRTAPSQPTLNWSGLSSNYGGVRGSEQSSNADLLSLFAPPTIEQLIAARSISTENDGFAASANQWVPPQAVINVERESRDFLSGDDLAAFLPSSLDVTDALWFVGDVVAEYSPRNLPRRILAIVMNAVPDHALASMAVTPIETSVAWPSRPPRLSSPDDRLAMRPAPARSTSWCVPEVLFQQLERLADNASTAEWASHVSNQLHALTERDQLAGDDVQSILADVSDAAEEAYRLADSTDDERLRVELLRAHWALARRVDCWAAMHEEHVAFRVQNRVAARGELSPYFSSAPNDSPTPTDVVALSKDLETYEKTCDPKLGAQVVAQQKVLEKSPASFDRALADAVEQHYRNANVRIAITAQMINRTLKSERSESRPVRDQIAGAFVHGQSETFSQSRVELSPANNEWRLRVETNGVVESNTLANSGPVRLRSRGQTDFSGSKEVTVRADGVHMQESGVDANAHNRLLGVTTDYDWVPLFGGYARDRAMQEYQARQNRVRTEMESRVSAEASDTLDRETHEAMERARKNIYGRFTDRFDQYGIKITTIEMKSTPERLVARLRVASDDQLAAHTPRPRALSDSLASLQLHETAMTNSAVTLGLDGQRLTGAELQQKMREQFPKVVLKDAQDVHRDTIFQFAPKNAVQIHIKDGRFEVAIAFDNVQLDGDDMPNVIVHAYYTPSVDGLNAELTRDGGLGIEGQISGTERARLHNIFQQVLPPDRKLTLIHLGDQPDMHLDGLMITQLVLEDGWVGIAIGPESTNRVAERSRSLR